MTDSDAVSGGRDWPLATAFPALRSPLWTLALGGWAFLFVFCGLDSGLSTLDSRLIPPLSIGLALSAEKVRLTSANGMSVSTQPFGPLPPASCLLPPASCLLVRPGRALIISESSACSLIAAGKERELLARTAAQLRKEGQRAYLEERQAGLLLRVAGLLDRKEAENLRQRLPKELREGAEVVLERNWSLSGSLALGKADLKVRSEEASGQRGEPPSSLISPPSLRVAWVKSKEPFPEAAHGVYRGEMAIHQLDGSTRRGGLTIPSLSRDGKLSLVNLVGMEDYLNGVLPYEMPSRFAPEALKAQAVAARTYALGNIGRHCKEGFDLCAGQHCQVYGGVEAEADSTSRAVNETHRLVMRGEKGLLPAFFHSTCGGHTEDSASAWGGATPSVRGVWDAPDILASRPRQSRVGIPTPGPDLAKGKSGSQLRPEGGGRDGRSGLQKEEEVIRFLKEPPEAFCQHSPFFRWQRTYSREELQSRLGGELGDLLSITVRKRTPSGRVSELLIKGAKSDRLLKGQEIRSFFGEQPWKGLPSNFFFITQTPANQTAGANSPPAQAGPGAPPPPSSPDLPVKRGVGIPTRLWRGRDANAPATGPFTRNPSTKKSVQREDGCAFLLGETDPPFRWADSKLETRNWLSFTGAGWGHGVGMCQFGADGMARRGYDFKSILAHYYGKFTLTPM